MTNKAWEEYKKNLPYNYAKEVQKMLISNGLNYTIDQIKDIRAGRILDTEKQVIVWSAIRKLRKSYQARAKRLKILKSLRA